MNDDRRNELIDMRNGILLRMQDRERGGGGCLILCFSMVYLVLLVVLNMYKMIKLTDGRMLLIIYFSVVFLIICVIQIRIYYYMPMWLDDIMDRMGTYSEGRMNDVAHNETITITLDDVENALASKYKTECDDNASDNDVEMSNNKKGVAGQCTICLDEMKEWVILNCGHKYHKRCLAEWLMYNRDKTCPLCRDSNIID